MLAEPNFEARQHSARLVAHIRDCIAAANGCIGFDEFMELALHAPALGYYAAGATKFGAHGDFVTAPLLGDVLGRCLARQCGEILREIGGGDVLEFGAGDGKLAADLLTAMASAECLPTRYLILETSAELRDRQRKTIAELPADLAARAAWLSALPEDFCGVAFANEVLDAMPALRFEVDDAGVAWQIGVAYDDEFRWQKSLPLADDLQARLKPHNLPPGYRSEINLRAEAWLREVAVCIKTGVLLLIDYGFPRREFFHAERRHGTLMCHYRHAAHDDPFRYPGLQDISVHLDFSALSEAANDAKMLTVGYASQGAFLLSLGALDCIEVTDAATNKNAIARSQQIQKLTMPHEMGELYKVIAFAKNYPQPLSGFSLKDRRAAL